MQLLEQIVVGLLVGASAAYVVASMTPAAWKEWIWLRLPTPWRQCWKRAPAQNSACNCDGCELATRQHVPPPTTQPVQWVKRLR